MPLEFSDDFSGQNLRGRDFRGQNLTGANFSNADIRGANFTNATLQGANFTGAKTGVQMQRAIAQLIISFLSLALLTFVSVVINTGLTSYFLTPIGIKRYTALPGIASLFMNAVTFYAIAFQGLTIKAVRTIAVSTATAIVCAFAVAFILALTNGGEGIAGAGLGALAFAVVAGPAALIGLLAIALACAGVCIGAGAGAGAVVGAVVGVGMITVAGAGVEAGTSVGAVAVIVMSLSFYLLWRALKGDEKFALVRTIGVVVGAIGGTSFRGANLTEVNFTQATLKNSSFLNATLTRTCWRNAKRLDRARLGDTYLKNRQIRELVITGKGRNANFDRQDLRGLNLKGASLQDASFIDADLSQTNLQDADLSGAILVRTQLERADLTSATLTGACIEDWAVSRSTMFHGVQCRYVFMKYEINENNRDALHSRREKRDQIPLKGEFQGDDFIRFVRAIIETLDLYHEREIYPRAAVIALKGLAEKYQESFEIVGIQRRENAVILKVKTPEWADQDELRKEYRVRYDSVLTLSLDDPQSYLPDYKTLESKVSQMVMDVMQRPTNRIEYFYNSQGSVSLGGTINVVNQSTGQGSNINISDVESSTISGIVGGDNIGVVGQVSGTVTNTINQLQNSDRPQASELADLLRQLQAAIETEPDLKPDDKTEALEQINALAQAGQNPQDSALKKLANTAIKIIKGTATALPDTAKLVEACSKLLPAIANLLSR